MRSPKSRNRGNKSRNRASGGNVINRVFDSSGPTGKVRGTPQQIFDKYTQLHRDAVLSGDRVDAENYAQHAEHYLRLLSEAQRELDARREQQEEQNRQRQAERDRERAERLKAQEAEAAADPGDDEDDESMLVETPENPAPAKRTRRPRRPRDSGSDDPRPAAQDDADDTAAQ